MGYIDSQLAQLGWNTETFRVKLSGDKGETHWINADRRHVALIGDILADRHDTPDTPDRDVHLRYAQTFADMLALMNAHTDNATTARTYYGWEHSKDGAPATPYAHLKAAMRAAIAKVVPNYADRVVDVWSESQESIQYCVEFAEKENEHRMTPEQAKETQGCWVEGWRGWTAPAVMINKAAEWGMPLDADDRALVDHYLAGDGTEVTLPNGNTVQPDDVGEFVAGRGELSDKATDWMNEHVAPEGWAFGWLDGEFYLWPDAMWEERG